jgi:uncharacterized DUF497 family protein
MVEFEWNDAKRIANLQKHKIDFADLAEVFENETATEVDERFEYGEDRLLTFGLLQGEVVAIVHTETEIGPSIVVRIISARKAEKHEQEHYFKKIRD